MKRIFVTVMLLAALLGSAVPFSSALGQQVAPGTTAAISPAISTPGPTSPAVSDLESNQAVIVFITPSETTGAVSWAGSSNMAGASTANDDRGAGTTSFVHRITISGLLPSTPYYYEPIVGGTTQTTGGPWTFSTPAASASTPFVNPNGHLDVGSASVHPSVVNSVLVIGQWSDASSGLSGYISALGPANAVNGHFVFTAESLFKASPATTAYPDPSDTTQFNSYAFGDIGGVYMTGQDLGETGLFSSPNLLNDIILTGPPATKLVFGTQPGATTGGVAIPDFTVQVEDAGGNLVTTSTASITIAIGTNPSGGALSGTLTHAAVAGVATFSGVSINKAGTAYTLTATSSGLTSATSTAFNVTVGAAAKLAFGTQPSATAAAWPSPPHRAGPGCRRQYGHRQYRCGCHRHRHQPQRRRPLRHANPRGRRRRGHLSGCHGQGRHRLHAHRHQQRADLRDLHRLQRDRGRDRQARVQHAARRYHGRRGHPGLTVQVEDAGGNLVTASTASITIAISNNPSGGTLSGTLTHAAVDGVATFSGVSINKAGTAYTLTATSSGLTSATSTAFNVTVGAAAKLAFSTQPGATTARRGAPSFTVQVEDAGGNTVTTVPLRLPSPSAPTPAAAALRHGSPDGGSRWRGYLLRRVTLTRSAPATRSPRPAAG